MRNYCGLYRPVPVSVPFFTIWFCGLPWNFIQKKNSRATVCILFVHCVVIDCFVLLSLYSVLFNELVTRSSSVRVRFAVAGFESGLHWVYM